ncbi:MAG: hypothetical protein A07HR67_02044 [uncultured archaeon A07HR67]|nr:MAG: hypothetical protein A07HR67_02044 [uncultured archaeon A07HR67]
MIRILFDIRMAGSTDTRSNDGEKSAVDTLLTAPVTAMAGVIVTGGLAVADAFWPALTVLAGALTASGLLLARRGGRKRYLLAGVGYCLGLATFIELGVGSFASVYTTGVLPATASLGAISGLLIIGKVIGKQLLKRLAVLVAKDEDYWGQVWEALAALGSLLSFVWLLLTFVQKVARYVGVSVGGAGLFVINMLGYELTVNLLGIEFEVVLALFVACVLIWFHLLDTLHNSRRVTAMSAEKVTS